jgi:hypothetical protein
MKHPLDYETAWQAASARFWRQRRRELAIHTALFVLVNIWLVPAAQVYALPVTSTSYSLLFWLNDLGVYNLPWISLHWSILLIFHFLGLAGISLGVRVLHYAVEHELLCQYAGLGSTEEKPKRREQRLETQDEPAALEMTTPQARAVYRKR